MIIGIDLGTTNSLIGVVEDGVPSLIPNALGDFLTPSIVGVDQDGGILVGKAARELRITHPERTASTFKRHMGEDWCTALAGNRFSVIELSSIVLSALRQDAENYLGVPVTDAVITVPAYFNEPQRVATMKAGELAGLNVQRIINEPTAAAIAHGLHENDDKVILVFDLGGGTFDVSIVDWFEGALEIRASAGETFLGGEDFTSALASKMATRQGMVLERAELQHPRMISRLMSECELAKRRLATESQAEIRIPDKDGKVEQGCKVEVVTNDDFAQWSQQLLARVDRPIRRALTDARLTKSDIDDIVLVGGATRMRSIKDYVVEKFGKQPLCSLNPDEAVARGAAIQGALAKDHRQLGDLIVTDVSPFSLGIEICRELRGTLHDGYYLPVLNRNTTIPTSRMSPVYTMYPNQTKVRVKIFQGEQRRTEDNLLVGEFEIQGIPPGPAGQQIDVRFTYDLNGVIEVDATVVATNTSTTHVVNRYAASLSESELNQALERMQALKFHPRDEAENRYLSNKAERVFAEIGGRERQHLDDLLTQFEAALEQQEPQEIEVAREILRDFLAYFESDI